MAEKILTTEVLMHRELIVYVRERSTIWQCRFKVDGKWQRATTNERDLAKAKVKAKELMIEAEIRKRSNLPVVTRRFRDVAKLAIERMQQELKSGKGIVSYNDYIRVIENYLVPALGKRTITSIDYAALNELDLKRIEEMGKAPSRSTLLTHNAALNRVFDEAVIRGFLTEANRLKLDAKGKTGERRPAFEIHEVRALLAGFDGWIKQARNEKSKESRMLMRDYVHVLLDTGARPGKEFMNLKWNQIKEKIEPKSVVTNEIDDDGEKIISTDLRRSVLMAVDGKTNARNLLGMERTVRSLREIGKRNYDVEMPLLTPLVNLTKVTNEDYVFRTRDKVDHQESFQKMFESYLEDHSLLWDPKTGQKRVFYSLRHTYATMMLTHDKVLMHTLTKQMGTSTSMVDKHYSHLNVEQAIEQLRGEETRRLLNAGGVIDDVYASKKAL